jgi:hypothetical protein
LYASRPGILLLNLKALSLPVSEELPSSKFGTSFAGMPEPVSVRASEKAK